MRPSPAIENLPDCLSSNTKPPTKSSIVPTALFEAANLSDVLVGKFRLRANLTDRVVGAVDVPAVARTSGATVGMRMRSMAIANSQSTFPLSVLSIVLTGTKKQMGGFDTRGNVTVMTDEHALGNRAERQLPSCSMGLNVPFAVQPTAENAVTTAGLRACEDKAARVGAVSSAPEPVSESQDDFILSHSGG